MAAVMVGPSKVQECPKCEGLWVDAASFEQICTNNEKQAAVLAIAAKVPAESIDIEKVCYLPCPSCRKLMNRVNFAHCSNVVVDVCKPHGVWFDRDELRRVVEFIRGGGIEKARELEVEELEARRRAATAPQMTMTPDASLSQASSADRHTGISLIGALIDSIFD
jgi:Zn-finger nucleic acid-binding protein